MDKCHVLLMITILITTTYIVLVPTDALDVGPNTGLANVDASFIGGERDTSGLSVAIAGDVNGDGYDDLLIGGRDNSDASTSAGKTYLIFGKKSGWARDTSLSDADANFIGVEREFSGNTVSGAGDVNGDGYDDILIQAIGHNLPSKAAGKIYLIFGKKGGWSKNTPLYSANASFIGENEYDFAGASLSCAGDVNGDGYDDILIGAPGRDYQRDRPGKTYLIFGKASGWRNRRNTSLLFADAYFIGEWAGDFAGGSVAGAGDVNGDNFDDFLIGAPYNDEKDMAAGQVYLIFGKKRGWSWQNHLSTAGASFWGEDDSDRAGISVAGAGDVNGDMYDDIVIGASFDEEGDLSAGQTYLIFGKPSGWNRDTDLVGANASFIGEDKYDSSGDYISGGGDVNGDGFDDIIIGAYANPSGSGTKGGQVYIILGKNNGWSMDQDLSTAEASFLGEYNNDCAGQSLMGGGDINGDGYDDILIGAPGNGEGGGDWAGQTYLSFPDHNTPPASITSIKAFSDPDFTLQTFSAESGKKVYLELEAPDADPTRANIALTNIKGSSNPAKGFELRLHETGPNTGKYRGNITIANRTNTRYKWINASLGGWVEISSRTDLTKLVNLSVGLGIRLEQRPSIKYVNEDELFSYHFSTLGVDPDAWTLTGNSSWLYWDDVNNNITGIPSNLHVGTYWAKLRVQGGIYSDFINFTVVVNNSPPEISTENKISARQDQLYYVDYNSTDDDQGEIIWQMTTDAVWLNFNTSTGVLNGIPENEDVGSYTINISVDDGNGGHDFTEFVLRIIDVNDPPAIIGFDLSTKEVFRGQNLYLYIEASDPENGTDINVPLVEASSTLSSWKSLESWYDFLGDNFTATYTPGFDMEIGKHSFRVKASDRQNKSSIWYYFNDTITVKNNLPSIEINFTDLSVYNDGKMIIDLSNHANDLEDKAVDLTWEVIEYSPLSLFDAYMKNRTALEIWPVSPEKSGLGKIRFRVTDNDGGEAYKNITTEIINSSERPKITILLQSPQNGTIISNDSVNLSWILQGHEGYGTYRLYLGDSLQNMTLWEKEIENKFLRIGELSDNKTYYWKISAELNGISGIFESDIWHFVIQLDFVPIHKVEISFNADSIEVSQGASVTVNLTFINVGNMREKIDLEVMGELKEHVSKDNVVELEIGEEKSISVKIFAESKLELKTYDLTIRASYSEEETIASIKVKVVEGETSVTPDNRSKSWTLYIIAVILFIAIIAILIFLVLRSKKKKEDESEVIEAEIEARPRGGITKADLDMLSISSPQPQSASFVGRLSYNLPTKQQSYHHKPLTPAPKVTLPQLKVTGQSKEEPKALPQSTSVPPAQPAVPVPTVALPQKSEETAKTPEVPALPMVGSAPTAPITPSVTIQPPDPLPAKTIPSPPAPSVPPPEPTIAPSLVSELFPGAEGSDLPPPPDAAPPPPNAASSTISANKGKMKLSYLSVKNASAFRIEEPMPCSICFGNISAGLQAARCSCGNISHLSCGIKIGKCPDCGVDYQGMISTVSQEAIIQSVEDSQKSAKKEVEVTVEWDEKGDLLRGLLKQLLNKEITVEEYKLISKDIKDSF